MTTTTETSARAALVTFHGFTPDEAAHDVEFANELIGEGNTIPEVARVVGIPLSIAATIAAHGDRRA